MGGGLSKQNATVWTVVPASPTITVSHVPEGSVPVGPNNLTS